MIETPHVFGSYENLYGIHRERIKTFECGASDSIKSKTAVLMLTPGMLGNAGPYRLHVELAESLSHRGIASFRFDLSGIGESLAVGNRGTSLQRAAHEVRQAIDLLEQEHGYDQYILFGLCSGADDAIVAALADHRIVGASLMDGCGYQTRSHSMGLLRRKYLPKVLSFQKWLEQLKRILPNHENSSATMPLGLDVREFPDREQSEREIKSLINRSVKLQFIYTSGVIDYYSYEKQFYDMFPALRDRPEITVIYRSQWDHTLMVKEDRSELVQMVSHWVESTLVAGLKVTVSSQDQVTAHDGVAKAVLSSALVTAALCD